MIEHERSYILDPEFATQIMESHAHTPEPDLIEDFYISSGLRIRHLKPAGGATGTSLHERPGIRPRAIGLRTRRRYHPLLPTS